MTPYYDCDGVTIYHGNVMGVLASMESGSVNCCITSPPYWGLRNYGIPDQIWGGDPAHEHVWGEPIIVNATNHTDKRRWNHTRNGRGEEQPEEKQVAWLRTDVDQGTFCNCGAWRGSLGLEPTPWLFVEHMVMIFEEVRRVLRDDASLWLNLGDSYATGAGKACSPGGGDQGERFLRSGPAGYRGGHADSPKHSNGSQPTFQPNRMPIPGLKPKDLCMIPHRVAIALQEVGWWVRSDIIWQKMAPMPESVTDRPTRSHEHVFLMAKSERYYYDADAIREPFATDPRENYPARAKVTSRGEQGFAKARGDDRDKSGGFPPKSHKGSTFYRGKTAEHQLGRTSDAAREDSPFGRNKRDVWTVNTQPFAEAHFATFPPDLVRPMVLAGCPAGGVILDPFSGAATTALVAKENGRRAIGIELNEDYLKISVRRLSQGVLALT